LSGRDADPGESMRTRWLLLCACSVLPACVAAPDVDDVAAPLGKRERGDLVGRVRAQLAARGMTPVPTPVISGKPARRDALVKLGQALVFDKILSDNHDVS